MGELRNDSSNIVELVEDAYRKIAQKVVKVQQYFTNPQVQIIMVDDVDTAGTGLKLSYRTRCLEKDDELEVKNWCDSVRINDVVEYEVRLDNCQPKKAQEHTCR